MKRFVFVVVFIAAMRLVVRRLIGDSGPTIQIACDRMEANIPE